MNLKYLLGIPLALPLLPLLYFQGKKIRKTVPRLPEATGTEGLVGDDADSAIRLLSIGESTIAGIGVETHEIGFTGSLARELASLRKKSVHWKVYAKSGYTAKKIRKIIVPKIVNEHVDVIVVGLGGNDAFTLNSPNNWRTENRLLIETLREKFPEAAIVYANMPPIKEFPAFTNSIKFVVGNLVEILGEELCREVAHHKHVYYNSEVIQFKIWKQRYEEPGSEIAYFSDGVHPSKFTYQIWAKDLAKFISDQVYII